MSPSDKKLKILEYWIFDYQFQFNGIRRLCLFGKAVKWEFIGGNYITPLHISPSKFNIKSFLLNTIIIHLSLRTWEMYFGFFRKHTELFL